MSFPSVFSCSLGSIAYVADVPALMRVWQTVAVPVTTVWVMEKYTDMLVNLPDRGPVAWHLSIAIFITKYENTQALVTASWLMSCNDLSILSLLALCFSHAPTPPSLSPRSSVITSCVMIGHQANNAMQQEVHSFNNPLFQSWQPSWGFFICRLPAAQTGTDCSSQGKQHSG